MSKKELIEIQKQINTIRSELVKLMWSVERITGIKTSEAPFYTEEEK